MSETRIFVSSTCYDLAAAREDIRNCLLGMGHKPLLSEYPSFPVSPDTHTLENCRKNIREHTDIFVLIVGCKRGSIDSDTKKSIVNLEYQTAKELGLDTFVFLHKTVRDLLPIWESSPSADFTARVDNPEVFSFAKSVLADQRWVFPFEKTADITDILKIQLSTFLRELIWRKREGKLKSLSSFLAESEKAQGLVKEKPRFWEFLLTAELLKTRVSKLKSNYARAVKGQMFRPSRVYGPLEFMNWSQERIQDMRRLAENLNPLLIELKESWGPTGCPGDPVRIQEVVSEIASICDHFVELEASVWAASVPSQMESLRESMKGWGAELISEVERLRDEIERPFQGEELPKSLEINLVLGAPPGFAKYVEEIERLSNLPPESLFE